MSEERPGNCSDNSSDDAMHGTQSSKAPSAHRGFTVQAGGSHSMAGTAERIGRAAGSAQRQVRRGLELVRPAASTASRAPAYTYASGSAGHSNALEQERDEVAARTMEDEIAEVRHEAAHRIGQIGEEAAESLLQAGERLQNAISRSRQATRQLVMDYPVQTVAALASFCVVFGVTLCVRGSSRR